MNLSDLGIDLVDEGSDNLSSLGLDIVDENTPQLNVDTSAVPQVTQPTGTIATDVSNTMTSSTIPGQLGEMGQSSLNQESTDTLGTGMHTTVRGMYQTVLDIGGLFNNETINSLSESNQARIKELNAEIADVEKRAGTANDWFTPANIGKLLPTLITLPVAYQSKMAAFMIEGAIGYAEARGSDATIPEAALTGVFAGGLTAGAMKVLSTLSKSTTAESQRALEYLKAEHDLTDDQVDTITKQWLKFQGADMSQEAKVKAVIDSLGERGAEYKAAAEVLNTDATKAINNSTKSRTDELQNLVDSGDIAGTARAIENQKDFAILSFKQFRDIVTKNTGDTPITMTSSYYDDIIAEFEPIIKVRPGDTQLENIVNTIKSAQDGEVTLSQLLDLRQDLGSLAANKSKANAKQALKLEEAQKATDNMINQLLPDEGKQLWDMVKEEYSLMSNLSGKSKGSAANAMGIILTKANNGELSYFKAFDMLSKKTASYKSMAELQKAVGARNMAQLERGLVKEIAISNKEGLVYSDIFEKLSKFEFVTPEGQALQKTIKDMSSSFKSDDYINKMNNILHSSNAQNGTALTFDLAEKFKYFAAGRFFQFVMRNLDFTKAGVEARRLQDIADVLANPTKAKAKLGLDIEEATNTIRQARIDAINQAKVDMQKGFDNLGIQRIQEQMAKQPNTPLLENKGVGNTGDRNLNPMYATETGKVATTGNKVADVVLEQRSDDMLREQIQTSFLNSELSRRGNPALIESKIQEGFKNGKYLDNKRFESILTNTRNKINIDDINKNKSMIDKTIKSEADLLVKRIEKDLGIKLPKSEAEKIVFYRMKEIIDACK